MSPAQFDEQPIGKLKAAPAYGAHTQNVLRELGLAEEDIASLVAGRIIGG